jgi:hypothetical protein
LLINDVHFVSGLVQHGPTAMLMKAERREERKRRTVTSYIEVFYVLNTYLNHVFLRGAKYPLYRLSMSLFHYTEHLNLYLIHHVT